MPKKFDDILVFIHLDFRVPALDRQTDGVERKTELVKQYRALRALYADLR